MNLNVKQYYRNPIEERHESEMEVNHAEISRKHILGRIKNSTCKVPAARMYLMDSRKSKRPRTSQGQ